MGGACSILGRGKKWIQNFGQKTQREETTWNNLGIQGRKILKWIFLREIGWEGVGWMHLAQDRDKLWALVNMVMRFESVCGYRSWMFWRINLIMKGCTFI
jgi:hypothetical protein